MKEQCDYSPHIGIDNGIKYFHYKYFIDIARIYIYQPSNTSSNIDYYTIFIMLEVTAYLYLKNSIS